MLKKPEQIYESKYFLICNYLHLAKRTNWYNLPFTWHNFNAIDSGDLDANYISKVTRDLWIEFYRDYTTSRGSSYEKMWEGTVYFYVIEFSNEDDFHQMESLLDHVWHNKDTTKPIMGLDDYNFILHHLAHCTHEVGIKKEPYFANGETVKFHVDDWGLFEGDGDLPEEVIVEGENVTRVIKCLSLPELKKRNNQPVRVDFSTATEVGIPDFEYYDITFPDGGKVVGISGLHLSKIGL